MNNIQNWSDQGVCRKSSVKLPNMTPPDSLSEAAVCLQITHPPNTISLGSDSFLISFIQECRNGLDLQHKTVEIMLNQVITSSRQRLLVTKKKKYIYTYLKA